MDFASALLVVCVLLLAGGFVMMIILLRITMNIKERIENFEPKKRPEPKA